MIEENKNEEKQNKKVHTAKRPCNLRKSIIITLVLILLVISIGLVYYFLFIPKINLVGTDTVEVAVFDGYVDKGAKVKYIGSDISKELIVKGKVDSTKVGEYVITYEIKKNIARVTKKRVVKVIDAEKPTIELDGETTINICPRHKYDEKGYKAKDNYDGDITDKVLITETEDKIVYTVKDSNGNEFSTERVFNRVDNKKPQLQLKGNAVIYINKNSTYNEPGYTATDDCDGNITANVVTTGTVNTAVEGSYDITYSIKDIYGNETKITRNVYVISNNVTIPTGTYTAGTIYLTFDDGPSNVTSQVLDILKEKGIHATFFVLNTYDSYNYLIAREYEEGHTVGLHSYTHQYGYVYSSVNNYFEDLTYISNKVHSIIGTYSKIIRFPGGSSNTISRYYSSGIMRALSSEVLRRGYHYFDWNVDCGDAGGAGSSDRVYQNVVNNLSHDRTNVVLMHDFSNNYITLNALRSIIDYGLNNGYTFAAIDMDTQMVTHNILN